MKKFKLKKISLLLLIIGLSISNIVLSFPQTLCTCGNKIVAVAKKMDCDLACGGDFGGHTSAG